jgi:hypothetical protein
VDDRDRTVADRDRSPIDQKWVQAYCDVLLKLAEELPQGLLRDATLRRIECVMDLVEAWQKRNLPMEER